MNSTLTPPAAYNAAARARQHTWLTVGGGAVLVPLVGWGMLAYMNSNSASNAGSLWEFSVFLLGIGIIPALLFALLREPVMVLLFEKVSQRSGQWVRGALQLAGTLLVFLSYAAIAAGLFSLYMWLERPATHQISYGQYLVTESKMMLGIVRLFFIFGAPWLLAALVSAWYVNRDLLPGGNWKPDAVV